MSEPYLPPGIEQATAFTGIIGAEPVLIVLPRFRRVLLATDGALVDADSWTSAICAHGARPMLDLGFVGDSVAGWLVTVSGDMTEVRIVGPSVIGEIYTGELVADEAWRQQVEALRRTGAGLVVITGTAERWDADAALEMMEAERAVWVRARLAPA